MQQVTTSTEPPVEQTVATTTSPEPSGQPAPVDLPLDVVFDLLSNERRRRVLLYLEREADPTTLSDLAEHIAAIENDKPERELSSSERKRVYICLYQCHLPKLDDANVVAFDEHRKTVTAGPAMAQVLGTIPDSTPGDPAKPLAEYTLVIASVGVVVFAAQAAIAPVGWVMGLTLGFLLVSVTFAAHWTVDLGEVPPVHRLIEAVRPS